MSYEVCGMSYEVCGITCEFLVLMLVCSFVLLLLCSRFSVLGMRRLCGVNGDVVFGGEW
jgi:hypothetical protein